MLSASGLLYNWRSRAGRSHHDPDSGLDPLSSPPSPSPAGDPHPRHSRRHGRRRRRLDGRDPSRRPLAGTQLDPRRLPQPHPYPPTEHEPAWPDSANEGESGTGITSNGGSASSTLDRLRLTRNDQLPGVVLQARARLQERLRGISLSGNSQTTANSGISRSEIAIADDMRLMNLVEWDTDNLRDWFESGSLPTILAAETDEDMQFVNRPPGLGSEAFCNLQLEVYQDGADVNNIARSFLECSICLEKFLEGDEMIRLSCGHRFHPPCLEPWVKTCGDCPYCRTRI